MKQEPTQAQKVALKFIEDLRARKENIKKSIAFLNNEVVDIDIQLRDLRQSLPSLAELEPVVKKPKRISHKKSDAEIIAQLQAENAKLDKQIAQLRDKQI